MTTEATFDFCSEDINPGRKTNTATDPEDIVSMAISNRVLSLMKIKSRLIYQRVVVV
jgi:hypothetical protein